MNIAIVGTGYVGLVTGTCLANTGHNVHCIDNNKEKIEQLNNGEIPIYEPSLTELMTKNIAAEKLFFTTEYDIISQCDAVFCTVDIPEKEDGNTDISFIENVAKEFACYSKNKAVFIIKSTVPPGTCEHIRTYIKQELGENTEKEFFIVSNPEFIKEGYAINDFNNPDRIVIGQDDEYALLVIKSIYKSFPEEKFLITSIQTAELIKYASNAMLATRISFINEIANICDKIGANIDDVAYGIGLDNRIGPKFLQAGCGYGGSCFSKDLKSFIQFYEQNNITPRVIKAVNETNTIQKHILYRKLYSAAGKVDFPIKTITILGTSFKPNTDDVKESPAITIINDLLNDDLKLGPFDKIKIFDPVSINNIKHVIGETNEKIEYYDEIDNAIIDSDALIIVTSWDRIKNMSLDVAKRLMKGNIIIDGRNILDRNTCENIGFIYEAIGK